MKSTAWPMTDGGCLARSVLECGSPLPLLTGNGRSIIPQSAGGPAQSKTWRQFVATLVFTALSLFSARAQGTGFTYQGRLTVGTNVANGIYDLKFSLYDTNQPAGTLIAGPVTNTATAISNGLFAVTLDFGNQFPGADRWLEIGVRTNGSVFTTLAARQRITATPYAITASNLSGTLPSAQLSGNYGSAVTLNNAGNSFSGSGAGLTSVNAAALNGLGSGSFWKTNGNAGANPTNGAFLGTTDNLPLEIRVNGARALRLEPNATSPNVIGGYGGNVVSNGVVGATIAGGGLSGFENRVGGNRATVGGGYWNTASAADATVGGGYGNTASGSEATVGGGYQNTAGGTSATVPGGFFNTAQGGYSFAAGTQAKALHNGSFVWGDNTFTDFTSTGPNQFLIRAQGGVGIGTTTPGKLLQVGDETVAGSQGMIRLGSRTTSANDVKRTWDLGVPQTGDDASGIGYSFVIDDTVLGAGPEFMIKYGTGYVGIGTNNPQSKLHVVGTVTATAFAGDGSQLTGVTAASVAIPPGMVLIPAGSFTMGNSIGDGDISDATPVSVTVSAFYMDVNLVSYSQWQSVYFWATSHGYGFVHAGSGKAANHPVQTVNWYDAVKWCNARSQQAGRTPVYYTDAGLTQVYTNGETDAVYPKWVAQGYRLPTEAEWEKAARGGLSGQRFPWGNLITENLANYLGETASFSYDLGPNGYNAAFTNGVTPYTSPVGYFAPNGYGLYDMAGNVFELCWDWYGTPYAGGSDPHGPAGPLLWRVLRGGGPYDASYARCAVRFNYPTPNIASVEYGFRCVRGF